MIAVLVEEKWMEWETGSNKSRGITGSSKSKSQSEILVDG